jgi:hypothetical protein
MANPTNPFNWQMPQSTDLVTDLPADFETFGQAVATSMADLLGGTTGQVLSKASNTDMDFTWVAQDDSNAIQNTQLTAKGALITAFSSATPATLTVGNNGETLVADSSTSTGLRYTAGNPIPNPTLNSCFDVWQRGTSFTPANSTYTADRWAYFGQNSTNFTVERVATGDTTNLPFVQYAARLKRASGATSTNQQYLIQSFESANSIPFAGKTVTYSFYARAGANYSAASNALFAYIATGTGTDQNALSGYTGSATPISTTVTLTTTWQRFTVTGSIASTATELATAFIYTPVGTAGANDYFEVTGVQIDIGSVALPIRRNGATIQGELAACSRYYQVVASGTQKFLAAGSVYTASQLDILLTFPEMRTAPILVATSGTGYYNFIRNGGSDVFNSITLNGYTTPRGAALYNNTEISSTAGNAGWIYLDNASASVALSAEL